MGKGIKKRAGGIICPSFFLFFFLLVLHLILSGQKRGNGKQKECEVDHLSSLIGVSHHHLPCAHPLKRLFLNNHQTISIISCTKAHDYDILEIEFGFDWKIYVIIFKSILNRPSLFVVCQSSGYWKFSISVPCDLLVLKLASYWTFNFGNSNNFVETLQSDGNFVWILQLNEQYKILMREFFFQKRKLSSSLGICP